MTDLLLNPFVIVAVIILLLVLIALLVIRRRRATPAEAPPPEIGAPVDYTTLPIEEPPTFGDRLRAISTPVRALLALLVLAIIGTAAYFLLQTPTENNQAIAPPPAPEITNPRAQLVNPNRILIEAQTNLPDGTTVNGVLLEDEQVFDWAQPESATGQVRNGRIEIALQRNPAATVPREISAYAAELRATSGAGTAVTSPVANLEVPEPLAAAFFAGGTAPTEVAAATTPTAEATAAPTADATTPTVAPTAAPLLGRVSNTGNLRETPSLNGRVIGQIQAGENVTLLEKTSDGGWFRLTAPGGTGWSSATLLNIPREVVAAVPGPGQAAVAPPTAEAQPPATTETPLPADVPAPSGQTARVVQGGNVRAGGSRDAAVVGLVDAGDTVQLRARTANNAWLLSTTGKGITGWINASLLQLPANVATLPVSTVTVSATNSGASTASASATPAPASAAATPTPQATTAPGALTARVFNGGRIRSAPNTDAASTQVGTINANETVTLLGKNSAGTWYRITDQRNVTGWVSATLLTIDPAVASRVPVTP